jgi:hypothetical protein
MATQWDAPEGGVGATAEQLIPTFNGQQYGQPTSGMYEAMFDYTKQNGYELSFQQGDRFWISVKPENGWWYARSASLANDVGLVYGVRF